MKKIIIFTLLFLIVSGLSYSQVKVNFTMDNPRVSGSYFLFDLKATVPTGQVWKVGASNIRVNFTTNPTSALTVKADNPVVNANTNISGANGYQNMTTTSVANGAAIGLNILTFNTSGFYQFTPGTYLLGTLRWNIVTNPINVTCTFRVPPEQFPSVVYDSTVQLVHPTSFTTTNPTITVISELITEVPKEFNLYQNYPNPFNPSTTIRFDLPKASFVKLYVYDMSGRLVETLVDNQTKEGAWEVTWDASRLSSGTYFYKLEAGDYRSVKKMILVK